MLRRTKRILPFDGATLDICALNAVPIEVGPIWVLCDKPPRRVARMFSVAQAAASQSLPAWFCSQLLKLDLRAQMLMRQPGGSSRWDDTGAFIHPSPSRRVLPCNVRPERRRCTACKAFPSGRTILTLDVRELTGHIPNGVGHVRFDHVAQNSRLRFFVTHSHRVG